MEEIANVRKNRVSETEIGAANEEIEVEIVTEGGLTAGIEDVITNVRIFQGS